jgi:biopolymer transport protein ExbD
MAWAAFPANDNRHVVGDVPPMSEINTTPLIDVMLVLLIMFIITVPVQSHQVEMELPNGPPPQVIVHRLKNDLRLSASGQLSWNGQSIDDQELAGALGAVAAMTEEPEVHFRPDASARYARVDEVLAIAARSGVDRFGFAGNEQYAKVF